MIKNNFTYDAKVLSWYDGDTLTADVDLGFNIQMTQKKVRLFGIDTPEMRGVERKDGIIVRDKVREWLPAGSEFLLVSHRDESGKYGRLLGTIYPHGWHESINDKLLQEGMAKVYGS